MLVISAHCYTNATAVTEKPRPRMIHDVYGFPDELFDFAYPAPSHPEVAALAFKTVKPRWVGLDVDSGLNHGTWSVLTHMFPNADVPVRPLSVNASSPSTTTSTRCPSGTLARGSRAHHGQRQVVRNLRLVDWNQPVGRFDSSRFDQAATSLSSRSPGDILKRVDDNDFNLAMPTPDTASRCSTSPHSRPRPATPPDLLVDGRPTGRSQ